ncbi:predicted protein [Uncinocarpus reesii 1704]|uniref:Uncharacterized protein n=1 Tax=Uncinocarpus reesii (strain UAMH 1704) TaxID=336963 RepID=C4JMS4_UNCRE|nr:uncharacterized protein UREG_04132 [Uncinocarpus reesii 1704]EEP79286.1 predicted protein [Uncinocarpus reesii 1704]
MNKAFGELGFHPRSIQETFRQQAQAETHRVVQLDPTPCIASWPSEAPGQWLQPDGRRAEGFRSMEYFNPDCRFEPGSNDDLDLSSEEPLCIPLFLWT